MPYGFSRDSQVTRIKITHDDLRELITTPEQTYLINIEGYLSSFEAIKDKIKLTEGLYVANAYKPLIEFNTHFYVRDENGVFILVTSANDVKATKSDIWLRSSKSYDLYIKYSDLKKFSSKLTTTPIVNYSYLLVLKEIIEQMVATHLYHTSYSPVSKLIRLFKDEYIDYVREEKYLEDFINLDREIADLVHLHRWNIYFFKIISNSIIVERSVDYRIYEWTRSQIQEQDQE